ncbi:hypothetical protein [Rothia nasimurium]|uniref:hypothetical protein n=1 Tax=Rothia nasimurium TaxID=85336 RepID=UPI001F2C6F38|nr:hypothetical protein [Rothia nasimurium]
MKRRLATTFLLLAGMTLSACSSNADSASTPTAEPTSQTPSPTQTFKAEDELSKRLGNLSSYSDRIENFELIDTKAQPVAGDVESYLYQAADPIPLSAEGTSPGDCRTGLSGILQNSNFSSKPTGNVALWQEKNPESGETYSHQAILLKFEDSSDLENIVKKFSTLSCSVVLSLADVVSAPDSPMSFPLENEMLGLSVETYSTSLNSTKEKLKSSNIDDKNLTWSSWDFLKSDFQKSDSDNRMADSATISEFKVSMLTVKNNYMLLADARLDEDQSFDFDTEPDLDFLATNSLPNIANTIFKEFPQNSDVNTVSLQTGISCGRSSTGQSELFISESSVKIDCSEVQNIFSDFNSTFTSGDTSDYQIQNFTCNTRTLEEVERLGRSVNCRNSESQLDAITFLPLGGAPVSDPEKFQTGIHDKHSVWFKNDFATCIIKGRDGFILCANSDNNSVSTAIDNSQRIENPNAENVFPEGDPVPLPAGQTISLYGAACLNDGAKITCKNDSYTFIISKDEVTFE